MSIVDHVLHTVSDWRTICWSLQCDLWTFGLSFFVNGRVHTGPFLSVLRGRHDHKGFVIRMKFDVLKFWNLSSTLLPVHKEPVYFYHTNLITAKAGHGHSFCAQPASGWQAKMIEAWIHINAHDPHFESNIAHFWERLHVDHSTQWHMTVR